jgi:osmotically-inducible protein OsmY
MEDFMKRMSVLTKCVSGLILLFAFTACSATPTSRSTGTYIDDKAITARVETALMRNERTKARQISIETYRGVVQLSGFVDSEESKEVAEEVAKGVKGVVDVKNDLRIRK